MIQYLKNIRSPRSAKAGCKKYRKVVTSRKMRISRAE